MASYLFLATFLVIALLPTRCGFQDIFNDVLPSPQVFSVNTNTVLVICRANVYGPFSSLQVKCNSSHKYLQDARKSYLTSYDYKAPLVTSRLLLEQYSNDTKPTRQVQHSILCHDSYSGLRSKVIKVAVESECNKTNSVSGFSPKINRKRKALVNQTVKLIWYLSSFHKAENSPCDNCIYYCYHDGNLLEQSNVIINKSEVIVRLKNVTEHDTGFYWIGLSGIEDSSNSTSVSSFMQLHVIPDKKWSPWFVWIRCSAKCGLGSKIAARKCLDEQQQCDGPRIRTVPCFVPCTIAEKIWYSQSMDALIAVLLIHNLFILAYCVALYIKSKLEARNTREFRMECLGIERNQILGRRVPSRKRDGGIFYSENDAPECCDSSLAYDVCYENLSRFNRQPFSKSQQSNSSNISSTCGKLCPKPILPDTIHPKLCAWGRFTEKGGRLTIKDTGVSLYVPKMALPNGTSQVIYIGLMNRKGLYPELDEGHAVLSPAVICGPDGLKFDKPVHITVPHNAVIDDGSCWAPQVHSCPTVLQKEDGAAEWKMMEDPENNEPPLVYMDKTSMQIMVDHFTEYVVVGQPAQLRKWVVPFCTEPKVDLDCTVRVYCIPATKAALEELRVEETILKGTEADARKQLIIKIYYNSKDIVVRVVEVREGWDADEDNQIIAFEDVWQMSQSPTYFPNVSFMFVRKKDDQFSFSSTFIVKQDMDNANTVKLKVSTSIKRPTSESSRYSSFLAENGGYTDIEYKIPLEIRRALCYLLDVERTDFRDYRLLGEKLGLEKRYIDWLGRKACTSPTNEIIEFWENIKSDEIPVTKLIDFLNEMERDDAAEELKNI